MLIRYRIKDFYPRSPCGERHTVNFTHNAQAIFLSTLSLRRATASLRRNQHQGKNFYPRSPCGERRNGHEQALYRVVISIHALLAESDILGNAVVVLRMYFYPRSPCGERLCVRRFGRFGPSDFYPRSPCGERRKRPSRPPQKPRFLSTLSLRRATNIRQIQKTENGISIHALLAESDTVILRIAKQCRHFYPRSPCGERLT